MFSEFTCCKGSNFTSSALLFHSPWPLWWVSWRWCSRSVNCLPVTTDWMCIVKSHFSSNNTMCNLIFPTYCNALGWSSFSALIRFISASLKVTPGLKILLQNLYLYPLSSSHCLFFFKNCFLFSLKFQDIFSSHLFIPFLCIRNLPFHFFTYYFIFFPPFNIPSLQTVCLCFSPLVASLHNFTIHCLFFFHHLAFSHFTSFALLTTPSWNAFHFFPLLFLQ